MTQQLRGVTLLDLNESPIAVPITLSGLDTVDEGLYEEEAFMARLQEAIGEYDTITAQYALSKAA